MEVLSLPGLVREVGRRAGDAPLDRVEAALAISEELAGGADELIGHFVAEARQAGCSWTQIGERIGVSKQAARQRFTVLPGHSRAGSLEATAQAGGLPGGRRSRGGRRTAPARSDTRRRCSGCTRRGWQPLILEKIGIGAGEVRRAARTLFPGGGEPGEHPPPESAEARPAVEAAAALARRRAGLDSLGPAHLLGALALDPGSRARRVLGQLGASIPAIKKELECYLSPGNAAPARRGKTASQQCSFCGWAAAGRSRMVAGPGVWICADCVTLAGEILAGRAGA